MLIPQGRTPPWSKELQLSGSKWACGNVRGRSMKASTSGRRIKSGGGTAGAPHFFIYRSFRWSTRWCLSWESRWGTHSFIWLRTIDWLNENIWVLGIDSLDMGIQSGNEWVLPKTTSWWPCSSRFPLPTRRIDMTLSIKIVIDGLAEGFREDL